MIRLGKGLVHRVLCVSPKNICICGQLAPFCSAPKTDINVQELSFDGHEKKFPENITRIVDQISSLTLLEVADLNELLSKRLNIKAPAYSMTTVPAQTVTTNAPEEVEPMQAKSTYAVKLMKYKEEKKVALIKEIKSILPDMNLVQAKKFVEAAPGILKKDLSKDEADKIKKTLEACGAIVELE